MSWSDCLRYCRLALAAMPLALAGCMPLYGALGPGGLESELQAIKVEPIADRVGHYVADELIFGFNGSRTETPPRYRLVVTLKERVQTPVVDTVTFRTTSATVITDAAFELLPIGGGPPLYKSVAFAAASYDRFAQRISNVRAARDAEVRDARVLADNIRQQVTAYFARRGS
jgi:LPS-assembly lipoprotein